MICPKCNAQLDDGTSFCYNCGSAVPQQLKQQQQIQQSNQQQYAQQQQFANQPVTQQFPSQPIVKRSPVAIALAVIFAVLTFSLLGTTLFFYTKYADAKETAERYEKELEKEKEARRKAEKEAQQNDESYAGETSDSSFVSYAESNRRATDISNAENIRESILADIADQQYPFTESGYYIVIADNYLPSAISEAPTMKAKGYKGNYFLASWDPYTGTCDVFDSTGQYLLTNPQGAMDFKNGAAPGYYETTVN